jgi:hypothetical protein
VGDRSRSSNLCTLHTLKKGFHRPTFKSSSEPQIVHPPPLAQHVWTKGGYFTHTNYPKFEPCLLHLFALLLWFSTQKFSHTHVFTPHIPSWNALKSSSSSSLTHSLKHNICTA